MSGVYALMDTLLPFEWLHYTFMKNALIAIVLLTPLFGMLGTMAVDNKMAFFSDALGHSAPFNEAPIGEKRNVSDNA